MNVVDNKQARGQQDRQCHSMTLGESGFCSPNNISKPISDRKRVGELENLPMQSEQQHNLRDDDGGTLKTDCCP